MKDTVITVENLSKRYMIGRQHEKSDGLRHVLERMARAPIQMVKSRALPCRTQQVEFWALRNLNLEIKQGEMLGVIGRNGAGKSTLLKLLSRITEPTNGRIRLRGRVASLLEVGTGFHPELTGRENIFLNGSILGMTRAEIKSRFDEIVAFAEIDRFLDTPVKRYSSGMYVRLAFAVAAHLEPEILIVDEVLAVGDAEFQRKCLGKMENASNLQGRTVILVSHQMPTVQKLCKRCVLMDQGSIAYDGRTSDALERYTRKSANLCASGLSDRLDRKGAGQALITGLTMLDSSGRSVDEILTGKDLLIRLEYGVQPGVRLSNCVISLTILKDGRPIMLLASNLVDRNPLSLSGTGEAEFLVPELPLSGGRYHISTYLSSDKNSIQDWVDDASAIDVVDADYYGTGSLYPDGWQGSVVLVRHEFRNRNSA
jgi:lipopolysaccharide transport system ATP-binding protein